MTDFALAPLPVCGSRVHLPGELVAVALAFAEGAGVVESRDVERELRCVLQAHARGGHRGFVLHLPGVDTGSVWGCWEYGSGVPVDLAVPVGLAVLPDCPAAEGGEACCGYERHPGGHTYELGDPWPGFGFGTPNT